MRQVVRTSPEIDAINLLDAECINARMSSSPVSSATFVRSAAEAGSAAAQAVYAQMCLDGYGVDRDPKRAFFWFARAAKQEHVEAINMVGRCYELGWGSPVDKVKAVQWFQAAAVRGLDWGMYNYATALALGQGVAEDKASALAWFKQAAALGNAKAINFIGSFHEDGWTVQKDRAAAAVFYARAAEGGDFRGAFNHARMLAEADRVEEATVWLERAADLGNDRFRNQAAEYLRRSSDPHLIAAASLFEIRRAQC